MPNQSLVDLTERTATADTDLIHVNSGGSDYKQTKQNFLRGNLSLEFSFSSLLTSQVDALPVDATYFGYLWNYGHTTETGVPINGLSYVHVKKTPSSQYSVIEVWSALSPEGDHYICAKSIGTWGSWTKVPTRAEITSLNNSLARTSFELTAVSPYTISRQQCYKIGNLCVVSILFNIPSSAPTVSGEVQIATVPEGFRSTDITYGCAIATSGVASYFYVSGSRCIMSPSCINAKTGIIVNLAYTV